MLAGEQVLLRAVERSDLDDFRNWRNTPELRRHFREHRELGREHQERWFERTVLADPNTFMYAIEDRANGRLLGAAGLCHVDWVSRTAELSIYIGVDGVYLDDKYAPDAARQLIGYGFGELDLHRMWVEVYGSDTDKSTFFEGLGFALEGRLREHRYHEGTRHDSLYYGLLRSEAPAD